MTVKKLPPGQNWVKLPRDLLESPAWRGLGINARRLVDFLLVEHLAHGGAENGNLKAPYQQLVEVGIGLRHIANAIHEAEEAGIIDAHRGGMRVATAYALTWLPLKGGTAASNRWKATTTNVIPLDTRARKNQKSAARR